MFQPIFFEQLQTMYSVNITCKKLEIPTNIFTKKSMLERVKNSYVGASIDEISIPKIVHDIITLTPINFESIEMPMSMSIFRHKLSLFYTVTQLLKALDEKYMEEFCGFDIVKYILPFNAVYRKDDLVIGFEGVDEYMLHPESFIFYSMVQILNIYDFHDGHDEIETFERLFMWFFYIIKETELKMKLFEMFVKKIENFNFLMIYEFVIEDTVKYRDLHQSICIWS